MKYQEDVIDFPVSDTWRDYYFEMGLTPYPSSTYYQRQIDTLVEKLEQLRLTIASLNIPATRSPRKAPDLRNKLTEL
jgi:hypothetical protein